MLKVNYKILFKVLLITLLLLSVISCTPSTQEVTNNLGVNAVLSCLESVVLYGLNEEGLQNCIESASVTMTETVLASLNSNLSTWSELALKYLSNVLGLDLSRSVDKEQAVVDILNALK